MPRFVLQHAHNQQKQSLLDRAIESVSAKSIEDAVRDYGGADQLTAKLVHVRVGCCRQGRLPPIHVMRSHPHAFIVHGVWLLS